MALRHIGIGSDNVVDALLPLIKANDNVLQRQAIYTLGMLGNRRAIAPLLKVAATDHANDPREHLARTAANGLFHKGGLLQESIDGVDRELLMAATS